MRGQCVANMSGSSCSAGSPSIFAIRLRSFLQACQISTLVEFCLAQWIGAARLGVPLSEVSANCSFLSFCYSYTSHVGYKGDNSFPPSCRVTCVFVFQRVSTGSQQKNCLLGIARTCTILLNPGLSKRLKGTRFLAIGLQRSLKMGRLLGFRRWHYSSDLCLPSYQCFPPISATSALGFLPSKTNRASSSRVKFHCTNALACRCPR